MLSHHRARVKSFDTLHNLCLALLATVLLSVNPGVSELLHDLENVNIFSVRVPVVSEGVRVEMSTYQ